MQTSKQDRLYIEGILKGKERALSAFYKLYSPKIFAFIKRKTSTKEDAEEILQDALLSAIDALRDFNYRSSLSTFLHAIAKRKVVDFYRKKKLKKILFSQAPQLESLLTSLLGPEEVYQEKQIRLGIDKALNSLKPLYRKILTLKYFDGKTVSQITQELNLTFKSTESMLFRARKAFAKALQIV